MKTNDESPAYKYAQQTRIPRLKKAIKKLQEKLVELEEQEKTA